MNIKPGFYPWAHESWLEEHDPKRRVPPLGFLVVTEKGLSVNPEDDYYSGFLDPESAVKLAHEILQKHEKKT